MANRNWASAGKCYSMHVQPVLIDCNFIVAAANSGARGISSLKGPGVQAVYMNSSAATPAKAIAAGTILVQLQDNYNKLFSVRCSIQSPSSGSDVKIDNSAMTAGVAYTITTLGNATAAKWLAIGVPAGVTPAVGVSFIALTNGGAGNALTSRVQAAATAGSGVASIELVPSGDADLAPSRLAQPSFGAQLIFQCRDYAGALVAPAAGSKIMIEMYLSNSSITVQGE